MLNYESFKVCLILSFFMNILKCGFFVDFFLFAFLVCNYLSMFIWWFLWDLFLFFFFEDEFLVLLDCLEVEKLWGCCWDLEVYEGSMNWSKRKKEVVVVVVFFVGGFSCEFIEVDMKVSGWIFGIGSSGCRGRREK